MLTLSVNYVNVTYIVLSRITSVGVNVYDQEIVVASHPLVTVTLTIAETVKVIDG